MSKTTGFQHTACLPRVKMIISDWCWLCKQDGDGDDDFVGGRAESLGNHKEDDDPVGEDDNTAMINDDNRNEKCHYVVMIPLSVLKMLIRQKN